MTRGWEGVTDPVTVTLTVSVHLGRRMMNEEWKRKGLLIEMTDVV